MRLFAITCELENGFKILYFEREDYDKIELINDLLNLISQDNLRLLKIYSIGEIKK